MDSFWIYFIFGILYVHTFNSCQGDQKIARSIDYPPQWRPVPVTGPQEHLISIASFDSANKAHIAQIAHHNAQILRQIKGLHPPITQYHNPYPMYPAGTSGNKHFLVQTNNAYQPHPSATQSDGLSTNLLTSSSNLAHTVIPHMKGGFHGQKPAFLEKPDPNVQQFKFLNSIHTSTSKIPGLLKTVSLAPNYSPIFLSTTSRVPILREVTLSPPPSYRSTPKPHSSKMQGHLALATRVNKPVIASPNHLEGHQIPGRIINSYAHFLPSSHIIREKPKLNPNYLSFPFEQTFSGFPPTAHFVQKNVYPNQFHFPQTAIASSYNYQQQQYAADHLKNLQQQQQKHQHQHQQQQPQFHQQQPSGPSGSDQRFQLRPQQTELFKTNITFGESIQSQNGINEGYLPPLPSVPPSVLSPFFQQIQQQQQQSQFDSASATTTTTTTTTTTEEPTRSQQETPKYHFESFKNIADIDFKAIRDEFSHHLVPPPRGKHMDSTQFRDRPSSTEAPFLNADEHKKAMEILNKYNIPAISPLQDSNRFDYSHVRPEHSVSSTFSPLSSPLPPKSNGYAVREPAESTHFTTEKPNVFKNLNRQPESEYKQHKVMHPAYTGARRPNDISSTISPIFPTPNSNNYDRGAITHSFFTIEDAVTLVPRHRPSNRPTSQKYNDDEIAVTSAPRHRPSNRPTQKSSDLDERPTLPPIRQRPSIRPTNNNNAIEDILRKPQEEEITEVMTFNPTRNEIIPVEYNMNTEHSDASEPSSTTRLRGRNKMRRRRPRPSAGNRTTEDRGRPHNDVQKESENDISERFSNHKENPTGEPAHKEQNNHRQTNRNRNRVKTVTETPDAAIGDKPNRSRRPSNDGVEHKRHRTNNFQDDRNIERVNLTPQASTNSAEYESPTTIDLDENLFLSQFGPKSRRPSTQSPPPTIYQTVTSTDAALSTRHSPHATHIYDDSEIEPETRPPSRTKNGYSSVYSTASASDNKIFDASPEDNSVILSTKSVFNEQPLETVATENDETTIQSYYTEPKITTTSISSGTLQPTYKTEQNTEPRDDIQPQTPGATIRHRTRQKEKVVPDIQPTDSITLRPYTVKHTDISANVEENEVTEDMELDMTTKPIEIIKDNRLNARLPIPKTTQKIATEAPYMFSMPASTTAKSTRLNVVKKFDAKNRPRFSVKDYRHRASSTSTTESPQLSHEHITTTSASTRLRFPTRNRLLPDLRTKTSDRSRTTSTTSTTTEQYIRSAETFTDSPAAKSNEITEANRIETTRKRFSPKDRYSSRVKYPTESPPAATTQKASTPRRGGSTRRVYSTTTTHSPIETPVSRVPTIRNSSYPLRRPQNVSLRQRIQNHYRTTKEPSLDAFDNDVSSTDEQTTNAIDKSDTLYSSSSASYDTMTEDYKRETAIMKIPKEDHSYRPYMHAHTSRRPEMDGHGHRMSENDLNGSPSEQSERVAELTIFGSNNFNSVNTVSASRKIPGYFTLATDDPILPIEAFFPKVKTS